MSRILAILGQLATELGFIGNSKAYEQILKGEYNIPHDMDEYTKDYILALRKPFGLKNTPKASITAVQF